MAAPKVEKSRDSVELGTAGPLPQKHTGRGQTLGKKEFEGREKQSCPCLFHDGIWCWGVGVTERWVSDSGGMSR
jgi:hypothetical protein